MDSLDVVARLVLVEDDETIGQALSRSLSAHGHQVRWVTTGQAAIAAAEAPFDLVLLDLGLPDLDGSRWAGGCGPRSPRRSWSC